jgi:hypothetical protein
MNLEFVEVVQGQSHCLQATRKFRIRFSRNIRFNLSLGIGNCLGKQGDEFVSTLNAVKRALGHILHGRSPSLG